MASNFDFIRDINVQTDRKIWKLQVRIIRLWRLPNFNRPDQRDLMDMVVMDAKLDKIQCTIWSSSVDKFEPVLVEGRCYELRNITVAINSSRYKPTGHQYRLYFKPMTTVKPIDDSAVPFYGFTFTPYSEIFEASREDAYLVDVIGVVTAKGDLLEYKRDGQTTPYLVVDLDDLNEGGKLRCTLWEDYASQLLQYTNDHPDEAVVLILQFAKMKMFKGKMGISNTTYNSKLLINADIPKVQELQSRYLSSGAAVPSRSLPTLATQPTYSLQEDLLNICSYKTIAELKGCTEGGSYVTYGVVKDTDSITRWSYRSCPSNNCLNGLSDRVGQYYCRKCEKEYKSFVLRYNIQIKVVDGTDSATFTVFDREGTNFLKISAANLQEAYVARGDVDELYPREIDAFKERRFLIKVNVKIQYFNYVEQISYQVSRLSSDDAMIGEFIQKYKIEEDGLSHNTSQIDSSKFGTPSSNGNKNVVYSQAVGDMGEDGQMSSTKHRKVVKEEEH